MSDQQYQLYVKRFGRTLGIVFEKRFVTDMHISEGDVFSTKSVKIPKAYRINGEMDEVLSDKWLALILRRVKKTGADRYVTSLDD
jgi:hypothetical protein